MKTLEQFLSDYLGKSKGYPTDKEYLGECLSICKLYIKECFGINPPASGSGSAYGYWSNFPNPLGEVFEKIENTDTLIPEKGWIVIWKPWSSNQYGHIAIVADGSTTGTLKNWAQNWTSRTFQLESNRYTHIVGFLKPKENIIQDMTDEQKKVLEKVQAYQKEANHSNLEGAVDALIGNVTSLRNATESIENFKKDIKILKANIDSLNSKYSELEAKFIENQKISEKQQKALVTANDKISELDKTIENITADKNSWQLRYNNKNDEFNNLSKLFEEYKKNNPQTETKFNLIQFIISLFKK